MTQHIEFLFDLKAVLQNLNTFKTYIFFALNIYDVYILQRIFVVSNFTLLTYNTGNYQGYINVSFRLLYLQPL